MSEARPTRRDFLKGAGCGAGSAWLALQWPALLAAAGAARAARAAATPFAQLSPEEAQDVEAIAAQIIPSDGSPGAREAGVVYFIDAALGSFAAGQAADLRAGIVALNAKVQAAHPPATRFATLDAEAQHTLLTAEQQGALFQGLYFLTVAGMFADPSYGGNRDHLGWSLLGFDHRHVWAPPFGYYDAAARQEDTP